MDVQYRNPDIALVNNQTALAKSDTAGRLDVVGSVAPAPVPAGAETVTESVAFATSFAYAGPFALTKLYLSLDATLTGAGPFYVHITDAVGAPAAGAASLLPTPKMTAAGDFFFWEPPGGAQFVNGIYIVLSTTPFLYTASAEPFAASIWTAP